MLYISYLIGFHRIQNTFTRSTILEIMKSRRSFKDYLQIALCGFAMGAADVVPGVSGGTMAFILGIYEELLEVLRRFSSPAALKMLLTFRLLKAFRELPWQFPLALLIGIGSAIVLLASPIKWLLENRPVHIWAFFFGLVLASVVTVLKKVGRWSAGPAAAALLGAVSAWLIVGLLPAQTPDGLWFIAICGAIAVCAMILPGISGSFILLLLGKYDYMLGTIHHLKTSLLNGDGAAAANDLLILAVFAAGLVIGISSFVRILGWLFRKYHDLTVAALIGFMIGSLRKVWPFKTVTDGRETNVLPDSFDSEVLQAILLALLGFAAVAAMEYLANRKTLKHKEIANASDRA